MNCYKKIQSKNRKTTMYQLHIGCPKSHRGNNIKKISEKGREREKKNENSGNKRGKEKLKANGKEEKKKEHQEERDVIMKSTQILSTVTFGTPYTLSRHYR